MSVKIKSILGFFQELKKKLVMFKLIRDSRTPWLAKIFFILGLFYFLLPFDFLPDFLIIPGLVDDLITVPFLIYLGFKFIPENLKKEYKM